MLAVAAGLAVSGCQHAQKPTTLAGPCAVLTPATASRLLNSAVKSVDPALVLGDSTSSSLPEAVKSGLKASTCVYATTGGSGVKTSGDVALDIQRNQPPRTPGQFIGFFARHGGEQVDGLGMAAVFRPGDNGRGGALDVLVTKDLSFNLAVRQAVTSRLDLIRAGRDVIAKLPTSKGLVA